MEVTRGKESKRLKKVKEKDEGVKTLKVKDNFSH